MNIVVESVVKVGDVCGRALRRGAGVAGVCLSDSRWDFTRGCRYSLFETRLLWAFHSLCFRL